MQGQLGRFFSWAELTASSPGAQQPAPARSAGGDGLLADTLASAIIRLGLPFDQLIWYDADRGGHVHVSFTTKRSNRRQVLHAPSGGGYRPWSLS